MLLLLIHSPHVQEACGPTLEAITVDDPVQPTLRFDLFQGVNSATSAYFAFWASSIYPAPINIPGWTGALKERAFLYSLSSKRSLAKERSLYQGAFACIRGKAMNPPLAHAMADQSALQESCRSQNKQIPSCTLPVMHAILPA